MSDSPTQMLWVERYRPKSLDDMALDPKNRVLFEEIFRQKEAPHLLLVGPPGTGKTTLAKMIVNKLDCEVMALNASKERGIDVIRDRVGMFAKILSIKQWKIIFLDESDGLTPAAQDSLRNLMEDYHQDTRFILTANRGDRIIDAIKSRCSIVEVGETPLKERILILQKILVAEGVSAEIPIILGYAERYRDLRMMINSVQRSILSNKGDLRAVSEVAFSGVVLLSLVLKNNWNGLVKCSCDASFDHRGSLSDMFWAVAGHDDIKKKATWQHALHKAVNDSAWCPDPVINFLGTCAALTDIGP